jgi:hypothetical protein
MQLCSFSWTSGHTEIRIDSPWTKLQRERCCHHVQGMPEEVSCAALGDRPVSVGGRDVSALGVAVLVGWLGLPVLDAGRSSLAPRANGAAWSTDCLVLWRPIFNTLSLNRTLANGGWRCYASRWLARLQVTRRRELGIKLNLTLTEVRPHLG